MFVDWLPGVVGAAVDGRGWVLVEEVCRQAFRTWLSQRSPPDPGCVLAVSSRAGWGVGGGGGMGRPGGPKALGSEAGGGLPLGQGLQWSPGPLVPDCLEPGWGHWLSSWSQVEVLPPTGELHLTPLHGILQLRPSFSYLDKADAKHREREAASEGKLPSPAIYLCD